MTSRTDDIVRGLMRELRDEDEALMKAALLLERAEVVFEVASQKYAAVRDVVAGYLGRPPCSSDAKHYGLAFRSKDRYRFIHMAPGDAVVAILKDADEPMELNEIARVMAMGGQQTPLSLRTVNAALMNTAGVEKTEDGKYRYVEPGEKEEELPFE